MKSLSSWYLDPFYQQSKLDFRVTVGAIVVVIVWHQQPPEVDLITNLV
jgi:hypothetical protein